MRCISYLVIVILSYTVDVVAEVYPFAGIKGLAEQEVGELIFKKICKNQRLECHIDMLPANRAERYVNASSSAGEIMRIWEYGYDNPDLIRVPTPYYNLQTALFVRNDNRLNIYSLQDISDVNVGVIRGVKYTNIIDTNHNKLIEGRSTEQLMNLLTKGRIDVAVTSRFDGISTIQSMNIDNVMILPVELQTHPLYVYIHPQYAFLVPLIDDAINRIADSGELTKISSVAEQQVFTKFKRLGLSR